MEREYPYEECMECPYRGYQESVKLFGPRTGGINFVSNEKACGQQTCMLERMTLESGAKAPSSGKLLNYKILIIKKRKMKIRKATKKDLREIGILMKKELSKPPFNEKTPIGNVLKSLNFYYNTGQIYVTEEGSQIIGVIVFQIEQWWEGAVIILQDLVIKRGFQNQSIGKSLMKFIEGDSRKRNIKRIYFETNKKSSAINFYKKMGYKINKDRISMSKKLK